MSGDPKACRYQANVCMQQAGEARTSTAREEYSGFAKIWLRLAAGLGCDNDLLHVLRSFPLSPAGEI
jgi:hypothetical protein